MEPLAARLYPEKQNASEFRILWSRTRGTQGHQALTKKNKTPQRSVLCGARPEELMTASLYPEKQNAPMLLVGPEEPLVARLYPEKQNAPELSIMLS